MTNQASRFDAAVFIGRFQPFHNAHRRVIDKALTLADRVIVLIGSANKPRGIKDPFFVDERKVMIKSAFAPAEAARLRFGALRDFPYNDERWVREVQAQVAQLLVADAAVMNGPARIALIGHFKDRSTDYLRMFPQWSLVEAPNHEQRNATDLRTLMFEAAQAPETAPGAWLLLQSAVPEGSYAFLEAFARTPAFAAVVREHAFVRHYKAQFAASPYPPTFVTVDAVVVHSGHVLLVQRRAEPGRGLWALPGGFLDPQERLVEACIRELREETRLKLPEPVLRGSIRASRVFDHPDRSVRGRTVTHAYYFDFPSGELPPVKGGDDAAKARWVPLADFFDYFEPQMFEDHFGIVSAFLGS
jgi:bifunctional NMN adenylyltransferase/nudix hydrolase